MTAVHNYYQTDEGNLLLIKTLGNEQRQYNDNSYRKNDGFVWRRRQFGDDDIINAGRKQREDEERGLTT